jgi:hypothetical protein
MLRDWLDWLDWLDWHRATLLRKCAGLDAARLVDRASMTRVITTSMEHRRRGSDIDGTFMLFSPREP